jgi:succinate dehydrogenase / fumarate reductase cytochrome b subunit
VPADDGAALEKKLAAAGLCVAAICDGVAILRSVLAHERTATPMFTLTRNGKPIYLNLLQIRLPVPGFMSILHRASGAFLTLAIPLAIYLLELSLSGPEGYARTHVLLDGWLARLVLLGLLWALLHHLFAGIRYLLLDVDVGIDKPRYRQSAWAVLIAAPVLAVLLLGVLS